MDRGRQAGDPPDGAEVQGGVTGFLGLASAFRRAGFVEVARPSDKRPMMRFYIRSRPGGSA